MKILGFLLRTAYLFRRHYFLAVRMDMTLLGTMLIGVLVCFRAGQNGWGFVLLIASLAWLALIVFAHREAYHLFQPDPQVSMTAPKDPIQPDTVLHIHASGPFAIRDQFVLLVNHPIQYTTARSREHILMAELKNSRLLLIGQTRDQDWGWWYQFIKPAMITEIQAGQIIHGWQPQLGLRIRYEGEISEEGPKMLETLLIFKEQKTRNLVWEDLSREIRQADPTA